MGSDECKFVSICVENTNQLKIGHMMSTVYKQILDIDTMMVARNIVKALVMSDYDTTKGIATTPDVPYTNSPLINVEQPAVLRVYYGKNVKPCKYGWLRATYGPTYSHSSVGTVAKYFNTKNMSMEMYLLGNFIKLKVIRHLQTLGKCNSHLKHDFNHCTVLIYNS